MKQLSRTQVWDWKEDRSTYQEEETDICDNRQNQSKWILIILLSEIHILT